MEYRIEHDSMGEVKVPADTYWAAQTERSHENFKIGVGIEIMQPTDPNGGIQKFLDKRGPGIHHMAVSVGDKEKAITEYENAGIRLIVGTANGNKSAFIHPKSTGGVLIELGE